MGKKNSKILLNGASEDGSGDGDGDEDGLGPPPQMQIGFDDFEILRAIGRGAFGKVSYAVTNLCLLR